MQLKMIEKITKNVLEYFSLLLVITYIKIHSLSLLIIGTILAFYCIKKKAIDYIIEKYKIVLFKNLILKSNNENRSEISENKHKSDKSHFSLVERVELLGFIPSVNNENDDIAA